MSDETKPIPAHIRLLAALCVLMEEGDKKGRWQVLGGLIAECGEADLDYNDVIEEARGTAPVYAAAPELLAALEGYHRWMTSHFDDLAEEFRRDTGMMAPGKDQPLGYHDGADETGRRDAWFRWIDERKAGLNAAAVAAIAKVKGEA